MSLKNLGGAAKVVEDIWGKTLKESGQDNYRKNVLNKYVPQVFAQDLKELKAEKLIIEHKALYEDRIRVPEIDASSGWFEGVDVYCRKQNRPEMVEMGKQIVTEVV